MPPRIARIFHIQVKTHKLTIMLSSLAPTTTIAELKAETLSALQSDVAPNSLDVDAMEPPELDIQSEEDFELCRAKKDKGKPTGDFEVLGPTKTLRDSGLAGWEAVFLQPRDRSTGDLLPVQYTPPPMYPEEQQEEVTQSRTAEASNNKGKRKAHPDENDEE
ncbi:hypothetical protein CPB84DRAFT_1713420 [Gymnopilus junonius]|uniref:Uncharacterized protein n=1 Tax=Gymnopilus junonius TaxID=109634 RepID=A0A9P5TJP6_GYMJU|nr:hypothetical protein CPB84DRAFT_1713420 [Gymnopilus junonius]